MICPLEKTADAMHMLCQGSANQRNQQEQAAARWQEPTLQL